MKMCASCDFPIVGLPFVWKDKEMCEDCFAVKEAVTEYNKTTEVIKEDNKRWIEHKAEKNRNKLKKKRGK
ncbi:MAG: hypothetical protein DRG27_04885 [Deltaproteobacteria bacterium]|nr:MAG: hypothetical protein DRG27_04885 [Deltaproteobacteria bacterium]